MKNLPSHNQKWKLLKRELQLPKKHMMMLKQIDKELLMKRQKLKLILLNLKILQREPKKLKLLHLLSRKKQRIQLLNGKSKQQKLRKRHLQIWQRLKMPKRNIKPNLMLKEKHLKKNTNYNYWLKRNLLKNLKKLLNLRLKKLKMKEWKNKRDLKRSMINLWQREDQNSLQSSKMFGLLVLQVYP